MRGGLIVIFRIRRILELSRHKGIPIACHQFLGPIYGALHPLGIRSAVYLRPERAHDDDFLLREILRDKKADLISTIDADERQSNSRVPSGGLNNGSAGP